MAPAGVPGARRRPRRPGRRRRGPRCDRDLDRVPAAESRPAPVLLAWDTARAVPPPGTRPCRALRPHERVTPLLPPRPTRGARRRLRVRHVGDGRPSAVTSSDPSTVAATPCAPAPIDTVVPAHPLVGDHRPRAQRAERRDRAALVAGDVRAVAASGIDSRLTPSSARSLGHEIVRSPGDQHEQEVVVAAAHDQRLDDAGAARRPRASAASASEPTRPCRVTSYADARTPSSAASAPRVRRRCAHRLIVTCGERGHRSAGRRPARNAGAAGHPGRIGRRDH